MTITTPLIGSKPSDDAKLLWPRYIVSRSLELE